MNKTTSETCILNTENLSFLDFLHYPDMCVPQGKVTFITGESGTGKSTLLRLFNNSVSISSGSVLFRDQDTRQIDPIALRRSILLAGQSVFLFEDTIAGNFKQYYEYREQTVPADDIIHACLSTCCANFPLDTVCTNLSGGERQRIFLAIFLSMNSDILMLDEPTSALDARTGHDVMANICNYCREQERTLIVVSHDSALSVQFAENSIVISKGGAS